MYHHRDHIRNDLLLDIRSWVSSLEKWISDSVTFRYALGTSLFFTIIIPSPNQAAVPSHLSRAASYGIMAVAVSIAFIITFSLGLSLDAFHRFGGFVFTQYAPAPPLFQASRNIGHTRGAHFAAARRLLSPQSERNVDFLARTFDPRLSPESATPDVMPLALRRPGPDTFAATLGQGSLPRGHEGGREGKGKPGPAMRSQEDMVGQDGNITSYHAYNGRVRVPLFGRNFGPLASILPVSYFVHNLVITLMKGPEPTRVKMRQHAIAFGMRRVMLLVS